MTPSRSKFTPRRLLLASAWMAGALVLAGPTAAWAAEDPGGPAAQAEPPAAQAQAKPEPAPWRGSRFTWRHAVGQTALDRSYLTYDPYYAMAFSFDPRWWFTDQIWLRAGLDVTRELTHSNETTFVGEAWLSDLRVAVGWSRFWTIPVLGIDLSADLLLVAPTSKASQARTLALGIRPSLRLARSFDLLGGLALGTTLRGGPSLHRYTTAQRETPLVPGREHENTGLRNAMARFQQSFDVWLGLTDWLSASVAYGYYINWLYPLADAEVVDFAPQSGTSQRFYSMVNFELTARPLPALEVGVGYQTFAPQQRPDSSYYNPFDTPYSTVYVDLRLDVDGLISQISGTQAERSLFNEL